MPKPGRRNPVPATLTIVAASFDRLHSGSAPDARPALASVGPSRWRSSVAALSPSTHPCTLAGNSRVARGRARATSGQIQEIVRYIEQSNPDLFNRLLELG
jgi:hypothetical protein